MIDSPLTLRTVADDPALVDVMLAITEASWPTYLIQASNAFSDMPHDWFAIYRRWPHLQFCLFAEGEEAPIACGNSLALAWDGEPAALPDRGWAWAMVSGAADQEAGRTSVTQCALSVSILPQARGRGLSRVMVRAMRQLGRAAGLKRMIAPVRPNAKSLYPLTTMHDYAQWVTPDGLPFDPWMRVHARLGASTARLCPESMGMTGPVAAWERWTGLRFPVSGPYAVPDCLAPLLIDRDQDRGLYIEPNVWMVHPEESAI